MNNYKLTIQYDGSQYNGWQKQHNTKLTIQSILENNISTYLNQKIELHGSGRTDAGVHAIGQTANFKIGTSIATTELQNHLNDVLPMDIRILAIDPVALNFHARLSATGKIYSYFIDNQSSPNVFKRNYCYRIDKPLNICKMKEAASLLEGEHDFISFCTKTDSQKSTVRSIYQIRIIDNHGMIQIQYHGNGFLYNMVRILSGTLIDIGLENISPEQIPEILSSKNRAMSGPTAPANALFLEKVLY